MRIKRFRNLLFYLATIGVFSVLMVWIIKSGKHLETGMNVVRIESERSPWVLFIESFTQNIGHPLAVLLLQIITIIITARILSWLCQKINQPVVIGEIVAGIVLGPSLIGRYFPGLYASLFPVNSLSNLQFLSQVGLILFMFVVGMELDLKVLRNKAHEAVVVSHASIIIPFALGMGLAFFTYRTFAPQGVKFLSFGLFMGISMSITAFPVLARMVQERGIHKTHLGALVITCAAVDDITAWSALAAVIAIVKAGSLTSAIPTLAMALIYLFIMLKVIKPFLKRIGDLHASRENLSKPIVALFLLVLIMSSYATEIIGIHALFGAFMAGTIMPDNQKFKQFLIEKVEDIALVLLLPLFFVYTGLRTQVGLLNDPYLWMICGLIILVAVTGKFAGSSLAARFVGQSWKNSLTIGALMNTRGLVELVALNIGFELGVLTPEIFTMLVIMALVTTFMTSPSLDLIDRIFAEKKAIIPETIQSDKYRILLSFGKPEMGRSLLRLAHKFSPKSDKSASITALHLSPGNLFNKYKIDDYERESFTPIMKESNFLNRKITPIFRVSENIDVDIAEEANHGNYDLLLMGFGHSIFEGSTLGKILGYAFNIVNPGWVLNKFRKRYSLDHVSFDDRTRKILLRTKIPVGVLLNKGLKNINKVLIPVFTDNDAFILEYAKKFINHSGAQVTVWDAVEKINTNPALKKSIQLLEQGIYNPKYIEVTRDIVSIHQYDLVLVSSEGWKKQEFFKKPPSVLIMKSLYFALIIGMFLTSCAKKQPANTAKEHFHKEYSLANELRAFYDIPSLPEYLDSTLCAQVSSYDTTGNNDDGFSGTYSSLRRNEDGSLVIFDQKGAGVINRIWTPTPTQDTLDFFIDDGPDPTFSICYLDLFSGRKYPFVAPLCGNQLGGYYCYLPIPFASGCKIVCRGRKMQFHQIQYRLYKEGTKVIPFKIDLNREERKSLEKIAALWNKENKTVHDFYSNSLPNKLQKFEIKPGETVTVFELNQGGRIAAFKLSPANSFEGLSKNMDIKITWDHEMNPAVYCPVADFFGYAFGKSSMQSLLLGSRDNINYCFFPMPFDQSAKIELVYRNDSSSSQTPLQVSVHVWYTTEARNVKEEGKFYANWNKNAKSIPGKPHVFLNVNGKGHYVGTILQAQGLQAGMTYFFEGDDSASIDGKFRIHGTGSEDYFNGGWYAMMDRWDGKMSLPLHGALDYSLPFCRTGGYRFYISDKLSFEKSFYMSMEHGPAGNKFPVDYTSLALYYSDAPVPESMVPNNELTKVFIPDTLIIYPQLMDFNIFGNLDVKTTWKYGTGGESYLFTPDADSWLRISLADIPPGRYSVFFDVIKEPSGCDFSLWQRQTQLSGWISTYKSFEERYNHLYVCEIDHLDFINTVTIRFRTDKQKSSLLLNRIILVKR